MNIFLFPLKTFNTRYVDIVEERMRRALFADGGLMRRSTASGQFARSSTGDHGSGSNRQYLPPPPHLFARLPLALLLHVNCVFFF
jgi:hypothetical protein